MIQVLHEHEFFGRDKLDDKAFEQLKKHVGTPDYCPDPSSLADLDCLGVDYEFRQDRFRAGYYIGAERIPGTDVPFVVLPKILNISYLKMFLRILQSGDPEIEEALDDIYHVDVDRPPIEVGPEMFELTPLLIAHFVAKVRRLVQRGLKRNYIHREEIVKSKVKGRLLCGKQIVRNLARGCETDCFCRYTVFDENCVENRVLKRALFVCRHYLLHKWSHEESLQRLLGVLPAFDRVSDRISCHEFGRIRLNPLYREYASAVRLALLIIKRFGFDLPDDSGEYSEALLPPFRIDMPRLFELYLLALLRNSEPSVLYQVKGNYGKIDFLLPERRLLADAKYKPCYADREEPDGCCVAGRYNIDDIRQLSGYARDGGILNQLGMLSEEEATSVPRCLILYPLETAELSPETEVRLRFTEENRIGQFVNFYKQGIALPSR